MQSKLDFALLSQKQLSSLHSDAIKRQKEASKSLENARNETRRLHGELARAQSELAALYIAMMGDTPDWPLLLSSSNDGGDRMHQRLKHFLNAFDLEPLTDVWENGEFIMGVSVCRKDLDETLLLQAQVIRDFSVNMRPQADGALKFKVLTNKRPFDTITFSLWPDRNSVEMHWSELRTGEVLLPSSDMRSSDLCKSITFGTLFDFLVYIREVAPNSRNIRIKDLMPRTAMFPGAHFSIPDSI